MSEERVEAPTAPPSREDDAAAGRHLSNGIILNLAAELDERGGSALVDEVCARAGETRDLGDSAFILGWSSLDQVVALFRAAVEVTGDPELPFRAGQWAFRGQMSAAVVEGLRTLGSPTELYRLINPLSSKLTSITDAEAYEVGDTHAEIRHVTRPPLVRDPLLCAYAAGSLSAFPTVFDFDYGEVEETACQSHGDPHCVFMVTWDPRSKEERDAKAQIALLEERLETVSKRFESLEQVSALLSATNDVEAVLEAVVRLAGVAVSAPHYLLTVQLPGERTPRVHAVGLETTEAHRIAAEVMASEPGAPLSSWPGPHLTTDLASARHRYGRLAILYKEGHRFMPNEDRLLVAYGGHATAAIDAAVAFEETRLLLQFSAQLTEITTTEEMTERIAQAALRVVGSERAVVLLSEPADGLLVRAAVGEWPDDDVFEGGPAAPVSSSNGAPGSVSVDAAALHVWALSSNNKPCGAWDDPLLEPLQRAAGCRRAIVVPLVASRQLLGVLALEAAGEDHGEIDEDSARRVTGVANLAATALNSARLLEMVQHQANHDTLTGLPNARLFGDRLTMALAACRRKESSLAVLFVDLDGFKEVNDRLGHAAGDVVLCEVAERLRRTVREADSVARLGGDEFVVLMPFLATPEDADTARERILGALADGPVHVLGDEVPLVASIGVARYPDDGLSPGDLLHRADTAMYANKLSRRAARR